MVNDACRQCSSAKAVCDQNVLRAKDCDRGVRGSGSISRKWNTVRYILKVIAMFDLIGGLRALGYKV